MSSPPDREKSSQELSELQMHRHSQIEPVMIPSHPSRTDVNVPPSAALAHMPSPAPRSSEGAEVRHSVEPDTVAV